MRVLVAEDDAGFRRVLCRSLRLWGFEVSEACDGREAWECLREDHCPILVTDFTMPNMDGMELVREIRAHDGGCYTYVIMVTGSSDGDLYRAGMQAGVDDFLGKPFATQELLARVNVARRIMGLQEELEASNRSLRESNESLRVFNARLQLELSAAARVQQALLPAALPNLPGVEIGWSLRPCEELAGDVLNVLRLDENNLGLYVLDVSGHGVSAALLSAQLSRLMSPDMSQSQLLKKVSGPPAGYRLAPPLEVMDGLNRLFPMNPAAPQYFTLVYGMLDLRQRRMRFSSAGQPGPIHLPASGAARDLTCPGTPVGMLDDGSWREHEIELDSGDRLLLFSDGVVEALSPDGEPFGDDRLLGLTEEGRSLELQEQCGAIIAAVEGWSAEGRLADDCSVLMVEVE